MCCATYRSSVGATGEGLDAAALCAAAALTERYKTHTQNSKVGHGMMRRRVRGLE